MSAADPPSAARLFPRALPPPQAPDPQPASALGERAEPAADVEGDNGDPASDPRWPPDLAAITALRKACWANKYRPLALYPHDLPPLADGHPDPRAGKAPFGPEWQLRARQNPPEAAVKSAEARAPNTGVLTDGLRGIDLDIDDEKRARLTRELCLRTLGFSLLRMRRNSPRCLIVYRAAVGEPEKRKIDGPFGKIEVLGRGQQFVAYGTHVSGAELYWHNSKGPDATPLEDVIAVSEEQIGGFLEAAAPLIGAESPPRKPKPDDKTALGADLSELLRRIVAGEAFHDSVVSAAGYFAAQSVPIEAAVAVIHAAFDAVPTAERDARWQARRDDAERCIRDIYRKEAEKRATPTDLGSLWNPWDDPPPARWPNRVLASDWEDTLALASLRDGIDFGAVAMSFIAAGSAAAPKNARFRPYQNADFAVPPIFWLLLIADSGLRKTQLKRLAFHALHKKNKEVWDRHKAELAAWERLPEKNRKDDEKPEEPHSFIIHDATTEALQEVLATTPRGSALIKDEVVSLLEFGRYRKSGGEADRAFYLEAYEDEPYPVHRLGRGNKYIEHTGLSIFGGIQPTRLAEFKQGMETDGLLQRFAPLLVTTSTLSRPDITVPGLGKIHDAIYSICSLDGRRYVTTTEGGELIRQTESDARDYAGISDFSAGWPGFCYKLHGLHARLALILHLMENPNSESIPTNTVARAGRLVHHYLLQQARDFYSSLPNSNRELQRTIAGWLLTRNSNTSAANPERILASDLTTNVKACRPLGTKGLNDVLDLFVVGDWLTPETRFPNNRAWLLNPAIRAVFAERQQAERERRAEIRARINRIDEGREPT